MHKLLSNYLVAGITAIVSSAIVLGTWQLYSRASCPTCGHFRPIPGFSNEFNASAGWMMDELPRKRRWTSEDVDRLTSIVSSPPEWPEPPAGSTDQQILEPLTTFSNALDTIAIRLRSGPEVTRSQYTHFKTLLVSRLDDTDPRLLMGEIQSVCYSRLIAEPDVRKKVERFIDGPDLKLRQQTQRQLEHQDMIQRKVAEGTWRERFATIVGD